MTYQEELYAFLQAQLELQRALEQVHGEGEHALIDDEL